jgi:hypothetical protein
MNSDMVSHKGIRFRHPIDREESWFERLTGNTLKAEYGRTETKGIYNKERRERGTNGQIALFSAPVQTVSSLSCRDLEKNTLKFIFQRSRG